jgi:polyhydroxyalkanoate synthesis regulator phasin
MANRLRPEYAGATSYFKEDDMSNEQLKATLKDLHRHLESAGSAVDEETKSLLQRLDTDIHELLQHESISRDENAGLAERAQELSARFAAQHPQLEGVLRQLGITLEGMGI